MSMSTKSTTLLLVDVQKDFHPGGSLAIPTADQDAQRIVHLIKTHDFDRIVATMDSHHVLHIAHPGFWKVVETGASPEPFTLISAADIQAGKFSPRDDLKIPATELDGSVFDGKPQVLKDDDNTTIDLHKYALEYTKRLERKGKFQLCIWPEHCLMGSPGHAMVDTVWQAIRDWSLRTGRSVEWVWKGQHLLTESYSAMEAEVPVTAATQFHQQLMDSLWDGGTNRILVCGQAMSHCVNYTMRSLVEHWPSEELGNLTLLTDCASSVPGFEEAGETFQQDMSELGVVLQTSRMAFVRAD